MTTTSRADPAEAAHAAAPADPTPHSPASTAAAPPIGRRGRVAGWIAVLVLLIGVALLTLRMAAVAPNLGGGLDPASAAPFGAKALAELVRDQDVSIEVVRSRAAATASAGSDGATLVLTDPPALSDDGLRELIGSAERVVLLSSSARTLRLLDLGEDVFTGGDVAADCDAPEFARVGTISADRLFAPGPGVQACFTDADGSAAVLRAQRAGATVTLVEAGRLLDNQHLAEGGNAALGLALLAQGERIVWYLPSFADGDLDDGEPADLGELTPEWLTPAILLLVLSGLGVLWWRGRRFGPLVTESLPVTVRASETMHGRARLTARAADAAHAAAAIRAGTLTRIAARLALGPRAAAHEVADAASDRLRVPRGSLYALLDGDAPASDGELIELARRLAELENAVEATIHTERNHP